jgi:hypothetical protein
MSINELNVLKWNGQKSGTSRNSHNDRSKAQGNQNLILKNNNNNKNVITRNDPFKKIVFSEVENSFSFKWR